MYGHIQEASLVNLGCNPFVSLVVTILVVGFVVWLAQLIVPLLPVADSFKALALKVIYACSLGYVALVALEIVFGIHIIAGVAPIGCG